MGGGMLRFSPIRFSLGTWAAVALVGGLLCASAALAVKAVHPGKRGTVQLLVGEAADFLGNVLILDDFRVLRYPSGKIRQYESDVRIVGAESEEVVRETVSVNRPLRWNGFWLYQSGYDPVDGSTVLLAVKDVTLPLAATGGVLLVFGAFLLMLTSFRRSASAPVCGGHLSRVLRIVAGIAVALPPVFIISRAVMRPEPVPALQSPLMAPHVASYAAGYLILLFSTFGSGRRWMPAGFFFMTLGLVLGAVWGKVCWGDFWQYDPKEMWALAAWLAYAACFAFRRFPRAEFSFRVLGAVLILFTLTLVNFSKLFRGLHSYA